MTRARVILFAVGILVLGLLLAALYSWWTANPKKEAELAREQAGAALESGKDAVNTVGEASVREAYSEELTRTNEKDIRDAEGADQVVAEPVNSAGFRSLCKRRAYRGHPECLQHVAP